MKVLILYNIAKKLKKGINSDLKCEEEISIIVPLVSEILRKQGHEVETIETTFDIWEILRKKRNSIDIIFNLAEGFGGANSDETFVPAMLEALDIPFTGASSHNMHFTLDKEKTKLVLQSYGVPTPTYQLFRSGEEKLNERLEFPLIVKPVREEASIGINQDSVVFNFENLKYKVSDILIKYRQPVLVEKYIDSREISIGIIGNSPDLHIFQPLEFLFKGAKSNFERIRSYDYKWGGKKEQMVKAHLSEKTINKLYNYSRIAYLVTDCRDYARMDFRVSDEGEIYLLEVNYNPGIGPNTHGLNNTLTMMASFGGITFDDIISKIINIAAERNRIKK